MKVRIAATALLLATAVQAGDEPIDWRAAGQYIGEVRAVRGTITGGEDHGSTVRLFFDDTDHKVSIAIIRGWLAKFPDAPVAFYQGKTIIASGAVKRFRDTVDIVVRDGSDIAVIETSAVATPSPYDTPAPGELEELRERVRKLERRMHEGEKD